MLTCSCIFPCHTIPLAGLAAGTYGAIVQIPKTIKKKMEVTTRKEANPIAQGLEKDKLCDYYVQRC